MTELNVRVHVQVPNNPDGLTVELDAPLSSTDPSQLTEAEKGRVMMAVAGQLRARGVDLNTFAQNIDRIEITESEGGAVRQTANVNPSVFSGVVRFFAPGGATSVASPPPPPPPPPPPNPNPAGDGTVAGQPGAHPPDTSEGNAGAPDARAWIYGGIREVPNAQGQPVRYHYWRTLDDNGGYLWARTRVGNPTREPEISHSDTASMWMCPADSIRIPTTNNPPPIGGRYVVGPPAQSPAVPNGNIVTTDDGRFGFVTLTPLPQENIGGRLCDVYSGTGPNGVTVRYARLHDGPEGRPWFTRPESGGSWTQDASIVSPEITNIVRSTPPGWTITIEGNNTHYSETGGAHREVNVSNTDGSVQIREGAAYRAATADDHLPALQHLPPPPPPPLPSGVLVNQVIDRGNPIDVTPVSTPPRVDADGWLMLRAQNGTVYRRRVVGTGADQHAELQKFHASASGTPVGPDGARGRWDNVSATRPVVRPTHRPGGGGVGMGDVL